MRVGGMFDGAGLLALGLHQAGLRHAWLCEFDDWRRTLLERRFGVPVYADVRDVGADTAVRVDAIVGGFPCKGASNAGRREGFGHPETVLWREMARAVRELRPRYVVVENVAAILGLHDGAVWGEVLGDLAACGYDVEWDVLPAAAVGAPHRRERVFAIARHPDGMAGEAPVTGDRRSGALAQPGEVERAERPDRDLASAADASSARLEGRGLPRLPAERGADTSADSQGAGGQGARGDGAALGGASPDGGVAVDWGEYEPAIRRWEAVHGPAPEPLIRRLDDGDAAVRRLRARMDRSRLSALGDGVHVYLGRLIGQRLIELEEERMTAHSVAFNEIHGREEA